jgi:hypothetical protein
MFPLWFFLVLMGVICYLLYVTRTTEETFLHMSRNQLKKFQYWMRGLSGKQLER